MKRRNYIGGIVSVNVDVDIDDFIYELDHGDKKYIFDALKEDLGIDSIVDGNEVILGTTTEQELFDICNKIYENRNSLTDTDKALLLKLSKKGFYDNLV